MSFRASGDFWRLLMTFPNRLDPEQDQQNVGLDQDTNRLTLWECSLKGKFEEKHIIWKSADGNKEWKNIQHVNG